MTISMYTASVPIFQTMLGNLSGWLGKAEVHAQSRKFDPAVLLASRLAPDMLPLTSQVQIACDTAKFTLVRVGGIDGPVFRDDETTIAQLQARIAGTLSFVTGATAEALDGTEAKPVTVTRRGAEPLQFTGESYLKHFALPNFFFHVTTAYAILRHNGVPLGKADYLRGG